MILFKSYLAVKVVNLEKTQTRRSWLKPRAKVGSTHWAQLNLKPESRFARILIVQTKPWDPPFISNADARAEGFSCADEFFKAYHEINAHRKRDPNRTSWVIDFQVVSVHDSVTHPDVLRDAIANSLSISQT